MPTTDANANTLIRDAEQDPKKIDGRPFKDFFINMLIRDLQLHDAIADLVDNSVDAARALVAEDIEGPTTPEQRLRSFRLDNLEVNITTAPDEFVIQDNCGGMEASVARNRAFRFGRDPEAEHTPGSVGRFGIGMKRALFKIGRNIHVKSVAEHSDFILKINVDNWASPDMQNDWGFEFSTLRETSDSAPINNPLNKRGLKIKITDLNPDVSQRFGDDSVSSENGTTFESDLGNRLSSQNLFNINRGLKISINGSELNTKHMDIKSSDEFNAGQFTTTQTVKNENNEDVEVQIHLIVGLSDAVLEEGGWYIFCNDRLVVGPEQSWRTGWTGKGGDGFAKYHGQFSRFRGYAFFTSVDASVLPWTTTKTDLDMDSRLYLAVRAKMIEMSDPVITFLNQLKAEREGGEDVNPSSNWVMNQKVEEAPSVSLVQIVSAPQDTRDGDFSAPTPTPRAKPAKTEQSIQYSISKSKADKVKRKLGLSSYREVGQMTFDYYYRYEIEKVG
ncbi:ATP-binding protein [Hymenobacter pini]|uniref:ATP-binding protein n=1 Tax=Hymenobacter pini TaxID=2880879 RepID=UPI001CF16AD8|nr:ATP-binding protein [Hymenobacter pini]MCA8830508.1 ATP-binding protein [Hymenobacter pini]